MLTFRDLEPGDRFVFKDGTETRECTKVDARHYAYYRHEVGGHAPVVDQEAVDYGRVGVGDNPVRRVAVTT